MSEDSVNVQIQRIYISSGHDFKGRHGRERLNHGSESVELVNCVMGKGLEGDRFFGYRDNFKGQITFMDRRVVDDLQDFLNLDDFDASQVRRNVLIDGIDLNSLIGCEFELDGVRFSGSEECAPCYWMDQAVGPGSEDFMKGKGGLRCRILSTGTLSVGISKLSILG
ncbi:MOSC domain-containing protein [Puniceicoccaceae bacterium K14]|nr:MOSC domain-containing protein [Puniceicoccaceae bacterium K14]